MPVPTASSYDRETQTDNDNNTRPTGTAGNASLASADLYDTSGRIIGAGSGGTVSAPGYSASSNAESDRPAMSREDAEQLYRERMEDEYAKREGGA